MLGFFCGFFDLSRIFHYRLIDSSTTIFLKLQSKRKTSMRFIIVMVTLILCSCGPTENNSPKNIILLIGDGMGEAEIALTRAYEYDGDPDLFVDSMQNRGSVIVKQLREKDPSKFQFTGESAGGATTIATGQRTSDGRISTTAKYGVALKTILEEAIEKGFKTGLVTTAIITDATPAAFAAHATNRYCFMRGDAICGEDTPIIEQMLNHNVDVMIGGGLELLKAKDQNGRLISQMATDLGYQVITERETLLNLPKGTKTLGIFAEHHMPTEWQGYQGRSAQVVPLGDDGRILYPKAQRCEINPEHQGIPSLEEMTVTALNTVTSDQGPGFFLMIEGALIDKQAHIAKPCGTIGAMLAFDRSVKIAMDYAKKHGNTAVIVTADHGTSTQVIYRPEVKDDQLDHDNMPGKYEALLSRNGSIVNAYYGTNNADDQSHTGVNVPIYSYGFAKDVPITGLIEQSDIYAVMKNFLFN